ncbi:hypothetical protein T492DRAFT_1090800 [Pavlovales sp. CCMP2436]|nr:hypothetical protein T492DRAFT_1090800 [Pavlovales sp. CCMP2436]
MAGSGSESEASSESSWAGSGEEREEEEGGKEEESCKGTSSNEDDVLGRSARWRRGIRAAAAKARARPVSALRGRACEGEEEGGEEESEDEDLSDEAVSPTLSIPGGLWAQMFDHQREGLLWLAKLHDEGGKVPYHHPPPLNSF